MAREDLPFGRIVLALVVVLAGAWAAVARAEPKNVILFIGDGMGFEQVKAAGMYQNGAAGTLSFEAFPHQGQITTYSANAAVTDSAAAATAIATGVKVNNNVVSMEGESELETLLERFRDEGKSTGLVTTTYMTHATPACFGAHEPDRNSLNAIADDYLTQTQPNVLFGGGGNGLTPEDAVGAGYTVVTDRAEMLGLDTEAETRVSGQFGNTDFPYEYDGLGDLPHLREMTDTALKILDNDPDGLFLMVEGGIIDAACHASDLERAIAEVLEFNNAVDVALNWAQGRDDTLIIVTSDHETGGLGVITNNGQGSYPTDGWAAPGGHTAANVPVYAWGPNAEKIFGILDNTDIFFVAVESSVELVSPPDNSVLDSPSVTFVARVEDEAGLSSADLYVGTRSQEVLTFSGPTDTEDAQIDATTPDTNYGGETWIAINVDGLTPHAHAVMKFPGLIGSDPGQVPLGATIASATLEVNCFNPGNLMQLYRLTEEWVESEVTWNDRLSGVGWSNAGADGTGSHAATALGADCTASGWRSFDVTLFVQEWANGDPNFGLVFIDTGTDGVDFDSSESANPPVLTVMLQSDWQTVETVPLSGTSATVTFTQQTLTDAEEFAWNCLVTNAEGQQSWAAADSHFRVDSTTGYPDQPLLVGPQDGATGVPLSPTLEVTVSDPEGDAVDVVIYGRGGRVAEEFTIIALPDTQNYSQSYPQIFTAQTQWVVDNATSRNIRFVTHEGDIVQNYDQVEQEWIDANNSMSLLDGVVPYGMGPGNHDIPTTLFNQYFPYTRYESESWYGGHHPTDPTDKYDNNYQLFSAGGDDYIILHLIYNPDTEALNWADSVLKAHSNRKAIITTHSYLNGDGSRTAEGTNVWNNIVSTNDNVYFVLCGHVSSEAVRTDVVNGRQVHQVLADYQGRANGGDGWLRALRFAPAQDLVYVETYSPWRDEYETDSNSQFTLEFPMTGAWAIGSQEDVASGGNASVVWPDLELSTEHEWFVRITDPDGNTQDGPVWRFTTGTGDATPPVISGIAVADITDSSATITWTTDEPADSLVEYGLTQTYDSSASDSSLVTAHSVPLTGLAGGITYHYRVTSEDSSGNPASSGDLTFTTDNVPVAVADTYSTDEDTLLSLVEPGVLANDSDLDGDPITAVLVSPTSNGTLTLNSDGSFTYDPEADFNGEDSFTYVANDGVVDGNMATVTITVNAVNDPPVAADDAYSVEQATQLVVAAPGVLGNDTDVDGDALTTVLVTGPASGTLALDAEGFFTYDPNPDFYGTDSFTYTASDGTDSSDPATVTIAVNRVNNVPVASDDGYTMNEDATLNAPAPGVLANDQDADGDPLTAILEIGPASGALTLDPSGSFSYTPNANFNGSDSFTYKANDTFTDSDIATVTITVNSVDDPPVAVDDSAGTDEDTSVVIDVLVNDSEVDGDTLSIDSATDGTSGSVTVNPDDTVRYSPDLNFFGSDSFTYTVTDGSTTDTATVTVTVAPVNDPPVASADSYSVDEDNTLSVDAPGVLGNDGDVDGDSLTATLASGPTNALSFTLNSDGSFTYTPTTDFNGTDSFTYTAGDGHGVSDTATVTITVDPADDAPTAPQNLLATAGDRTVSLQWDASSDPDWNLSGYNVYRAPSSGGYDFGAPLAFVAASQTTTTYTDSGLDNDTPYYYVVKAVDSTSPTPLESPESNEASATPSNTQYDAYASQDPTITFGALEGDGVVGTTVEGDGLVQTITEGPNGKAGMASLDAVYVLHTTADPADVTTVELYLTSTWTQGDGAADSLLVDIYSEAAGDWVPVAHDFGTGPFPADPQDHVDASGDIRVRFTDTEAIRKEIKDILTIDLLYAHVGVGPQNSPPVAGDDAYTADEDIPLTKDAADGVLKNDTDTEGDPLTAILVGSPSDGNVVLNDDGSFTYTPNSDFSGIDSFTYKANDGGSDSNNATVTITVINANDAPVAADDSYSVEQNDTLSVSAPGVLGNDTDADADALDAVLQDNVSHGLLTLNSDGSFDYMPEGGFNGTDSFTYKANDTVLDSNVATVTITVTAPNTPPTAADDAYTTAEDTPLNVAAPGVLGNDDDADGGPGPLSAILVADVSSGTLSLNADGSFSYIPAANSNGTDTFTYKANDTIADSNIATVTITVNAVNDAPVALDDVYSVDQDTVLTVPAPGLLDNDSDVDGDALNAVLVSDVSNGTLSLSDDGSFQYTPSGGFTGDDSFSYRANDGTVGSETATVTITVNPTGGTTVHVQNIDMETRLAGKKTKAVATVLISPALANASVVGDWLFNGVFVEQSEPSVTDESGTVVMSSPPRNATSGDTFTFRVTDITLSGYPYAPGDNVETEDSITVLP